MKVRDGYKMTEFGEIPEPGFTGLKDLQNFKYVFEERL